MFHKIIKKCFSKKIHINGLKVHKVYNLFGIKLKFCIIKNEKYHINKYLRNLSPYKTVPHKIWEVEDKSSILKLDWNEGTMPPSPKVNEAVNKLLSKPDFFNLYPKTTNNELLELLSSYTNLPTKNIQYFASSDSAHEYIAKIFIGEGDKVLISSPSYDNFRLTIQANGAQVFYSEIDSNFEFNAKNFEKDIKNIKPTFVYIVNPNNPTGNVLSASYIERLVKNNPDKMFLVDEAYYEFSKETCANLVQKYENIVISRTLSKAFALANFRFGYLLASESNIKSISNIRNPKNITTFAQVAATAALSDIPYMENYVNEVNCAKEYFINEIQRFAPDITVHKSSANFLLMKFKDFKLRCDVFNFLKEHNIYIRNPLHSTLLYNCLRISIGTKEQMKRVVDCIDDFMRNGKTKETANDKIALFDFCGTIVNFQSGNPYIFYVLNELNSPVLNLKNRLRKIKLKLMRKINKNFLDKNDILYLLKGMHYDDLDRFALEYYIKEVRPRFYSNVMDKLQQLKAEGYKIYVVSAGYEIYLKYFIQEFGLDGVIATKIKFDKNNHCLGVFDGKDCIKEEKTVYLHKYLNSEMRCSTKVLGFTDSCTDIPMLKMCTDRYVVTRHKEGWMEELNCEVINV